MQRILTHLTSLSNNDLQHQQLKVINNVTGPQDPFPPTAESDSKIQTKSNLPTQVKMIYGDGWCLFCLVAVACDMVLLSCAKNAGGWPKVANLATCKTEFADKLRNKTVDLWRANKPIYECHAHYLELDHFWMDNRYENIDKRISELAKPKTFASEAQLLALVHVIKWPIVVHYQYAQEFAAGRGIHRICQYS